MRSLRSTLLATALSTLAACGSEAPSSVIADASSQPDVVAPVDVPAAVDAPAPVDRPAPADAPLPADPCPSFCARVVGATGCMRNMTACVSDCGTQIRTTPAECRRELDAYFACGIASTASCTGGVLSFAGCDDAQTALVLCVASPDGGADPCARKIDCGGCVATAGCGWCGRCLPGTATGPTQPTACGAQRWVRDSAMCL